MGGLGLAVGARARAAEAKVRRGRGRAEGGGTLIGRSMAQTAAERHAMIESEN